MEKLLAEAAALFSRRATRLCPFCSKDTNKEVFRDRLSAREAEISGLCQKCQDDFFGRR